MELAQLRRLTTRRARGWTHHEHQKGGISLRGPGETQLELDVTQAFYDAALFPAWKGSLFIGALRGAHLVRLELDGKRIVREEQLLSERNARIRDVRQGPDGWLYVLTDSPDGQVWRLER